MRIIVQQLSSFDVWCPGESFHITRGDKVDRPLEDSYGVTNHVVEDYGSVHVQQGCLLVRTFIVTNLGYGKVEVRPRRRPRWARRLFGDGIEIVDVTAAPE